MTDMSQAKILIIATHGFEQSELEGPRDGLRDAGATVHIASPDGNAIKGWKGDDWGSPVEVDLKLEDVKADQYDALVLPGGQINPDILRTNAVALAIIKAMHDAGKTVGAICHAPWLLVEIGALSGCEATSFGSIKTDLINAGARWVDKEVVNHHGLITSRSPEDIDAFVAEIISQVEHGNAQRRAA